MKIRTKKQTQEKEDVKILIIYIGNDRYGIRESMDQKLCVYKLLDGNTDSINIQLARMKLK